MSGISKKNKNLAIEYNEKLQVAIQRKNKILLIVDNSKIYTSDLYKNLVKTLAVAVICCF